MSKSIKTTMDKFIQETVDTYKIRIIYVDCDKYGFDDVDLLLVDLKTNKAIGEYIGCEQYDDEFTRKDFEFY